jgi:hypothetical protein
VTELLDALPGFIGGLLSGIIGGYYAGRAQVSYQLRATAVTEISRLTIEAMQAFRNWIMVPAYTDGPGDYHKGPYVGAKIDSLSVYYRANAEWIDGRARDSVESIVQGFTGHYAAHMEACHIRDWRKKQRETARAANTWLSQELPGLLHEVRALPWWRRMFGK